MSTNAIAGSVTMTLAERRGRGETVIVENGAEVVSGRLLVSEALIEHGIILEEHNAFWRHHSPYRSDHAEIDAEITADLDGKVEEIVYHVRNMFREERLAADRRAYDVAREADRTEDM